MIVGTAGHIDHGKTSLIKRLTGRDTDRLPEEKKRGISIELGYAYVPTGNGGDQADTIGFVDVPGHERFVHTMLAGATGIDFALLAIAADDGVMPQTDEHLDILWLLGIDAGAVALTKIDTVDSARIDEVRRQLAERTHGTPATHWPVFAVSSTSGAGIGALQTHLLDVAARHPAHPPGGHFRMAVDRSFTLPGVGTIVTGTAHAGSIRTGEPVAIGPAMHGLHARVRSIHAQDRPAAIGRARQRCALALAGIEKSAVGRGMWVQAPALSNFSQRFDATLTLSPRAGKALGGATTVHLHHGTADAMARVSVLDAARIEPGELRLVAVTLDRPLALCRGDRFVIRDASAQRTLGGGTALEVMPPAAAARRGRRAPARLQLLAAVRDHSAAQAMRHWLDQQPLALSRLASNWNLRDDEMLRLIDATGARVAAGVALSASHWQRLCGDVVAAVGAVHQSEPEMPGIEQQRLRRMVAPALETEVFGAVVDQLLGDASLQRRGAYLAWPSHTAELAKDQRARWERIRPLLNDRKFDPPRVRDIARETRLPEVEVRHLMRTVARTGDVMQVAHDHFFLTAAVADLADIAGAVAEHHGAARAAEFRDRIATGRKLAIQILEFFDKVGYLRRVGDDHVVRRANPWRVQSQ